MTLYLIGLGLNDKEDLTIKGFKIIKKCDLIYLENYTSLMQNSVKELEKQYNKKIIKLERTDVESDKLIKEAKKKEVALLVIGDPLIATTHISLLMEAKKAKVKTHIIHNSSILTVISETGLSLYKLGAIASIPFDNKNIKTPIEIIKNNLKMNLHTLVLLDLNPQENRYLTIKEAINYLMNNGLNKNQLCVGCARLGGKSKIKSGKALTLLKEDFGKPPYCLIIPSKLNFVEEEALKIFTDFNS